MRGGEDAKSWTGSGTASVIVLRPMLTYARTRKVDIAPILEQVGCATLLDLDAPDHRIAETVRARAWILAAEQSHDPVFGLNVARYAKMGSYDVLDYALYFSGTLREAFDHITRFHRVLCDAWAFENQTRSGAMHMRRTVRTPRQEAEANFALLVLRARELTGVDVAPREVRFTHTAPADVAPHAALFRCPVRFGRSASELVFHDTDLERSVRSANPGVSRILDRDMTDLLTRIPKSESFVERARAVVSRTIRTPPTLESTARALHASPRTLQRKLRDDGTSFTEVVDSVRREMAERLVSDKRVSITEAAFLCGFADISGFRRMYKRWTGASPVHARSRGA